MGWLDMWREARGDVMRKEFEEIKARIRFCERLGNAW
jgi:hypothetical protein